MRLRVSPDSRRILSKAPNARSRSSSFSKRASLPASRKTTRLPLRSPILRRIAAGTVTRPFDETVATSAIAGEEAAPTHSVCRRIHRVVVSGAGGSGAASWRVSASA